LASGAGDAAPVDNGSRNGPAVTKRTWILRPKSLIDGAAGRIRTHDPLVRRRDRDVLVASTPVQVLLGHSLRTVSPSKRQTSSAHPSETYRPRSANRP
jgi:hypothetical protein